MNTYPNLQIWILQGVVNFTTCLVFREDNPFSSGSKMFPFFFLLSSSATPAHSGPCFQLWYGHVVRALSFLLFFSADYHDNCSQPSLQLLRMIGKWIWGLSNRTLNQVVFASVFFVVNSSYSLKPSTGISCFASNWNSPPTCVGATEASSVSVCWKRWKLSFRCLIGSLQFRTAKLMTEAPTSGITSSITYCLKSRTEARPPIHSIPPVYSFVKSNSAKTH